MASDGGVQADPRLTTAICRNASKNTFEALLRLTLSVTIVVGVNCGEGRRGWEDGGGGGGAVVAVPAAVVGAVKEPALVAKSGG